MVWRFQDMAVGYGYALLRDFQSAEDAAQEAFLEAYRNLGKLREAAATGRAERVRALLNSKPDLANAFAPAGFTPLGLAAFFGHLEAAKVLLDGGAGVNVSSRNALKAVPLRSAAVAGHLDDARLLVARGADVNARCEGGQTPLHEVAGGGRVEFARLLLDQRADVNARGDDGKRPLTVALNNKQAEMADFLRSRGGTE